MKVVELTNAKDRSRQKEHTKNGGRAKGERGNRGDISPRKNSLGIRAERRN